MFKVANRTMQSTFSILDVIVPWLQHDVSVSET